MAAPLPWLSVTSHIHRLPRRLLHPSEPSNWLPPTSRERDQIVRPSPAECGKRQTAPVESWRPTQPAVERLLSDAFGVPVAIKGWEHLRPWSVQRTHLSGGAGDGLPESVIVKWLRDHPSGIRTQLSQVATERAGLEFLTGLGVDLAPRLIGGDHTAGVLVLEDLHPRVPLSDLLAREDPLASTGLLAFARALGELHAATVGHEDGYYERRGMLGPVDPSIERERFLGRGWRETPAWTGAMLGVPVSADIERELAAVLAVFSDPGPFLAFSNGDAGSNNFMFRSADGRLIDFEFAGYRHALSDAVCLFVPGPAWITVPLAGDLEVVYRKALCQAVPEAEDEHRFGLGIAAASLAYAILRLGRFSILDARPPGDNSRAQQVSTLEQASAVADTHRSLPHLTGWARGVAEALRRRWPDTDIDYDTSRYLPRW